MTFGGFVKLEETYKGTLLIVSATETPVNADALPTYRSYGPDGFVKSGTTTFKDSGTITSATNAGPVVITSTGHGLTTGVLVTVVGVTGNTGANGTFNITLVDANNFSLDGSTGNGAYINGGTWNVTGLYAFTIIAQGIDGYEAGEGYQLQFQYDVLSVEKSQLHSFQVN